MSDWLSAGEVIDLDVSPMEIVGGEPLRGCSSSLELLATIHSEQREVQELMRTFSELQIKQLKEHQFTLDKHVRRHHMAVQAAVAAKLKCVPPAGSGSLLVSNFSPQSTMSAMSESQLASEMPEEPGMPPKETMLAVCPTDAQQQVRLSVNVGEGGDKDRPAKRGRRTKREKEWQQWRAISDSSSTSSVSPEMLKKRLFNDYQFNFSRSDQQSRMKCGCGLEPLKQESLRCVRLKQFVSSFEFAVAIGMLILLNAIFIGVSNNASMRAAIEQYHTRRDVEKPKAYYWIDVVFSCIFCAELILRVVAYQWHFLFGPEWAWNGLDTALVVTSMGEIALSTFDYEFNYIRLLRLLRSVRTFRVVRILRFASFFRDLRLMLLAITKSAVPLMWGIFILIFLMSSSRWCSPTRPPAT